MKPKTVDFSQARFKHMNWQFRIRNFLDGKESLTRDQAVSHKHCELGKWFYAEGKAKYGHLSAMQKFEVEHENLHNMVGSILSFKEKNQLDKAEAGYQELVKISKKIVGYLDDAEKEINK